MTEIQLAVIEAIKIKHKPDDHPQNEVKRAKKICQELQAFQAKELALAKALEQKEASALTDAEMHYQIARIYWKGAIWNLGIRG